MQNVHSSSAFDHPSCSSHACPAPQGGKAKGSQTTLTDPAPRPCNGNLGDEFSWKLRSVPERKSHRKKIHDQKKIKSFYILRPIWRSGGRCASQRGTLPASDVARPGDAPAQCVGLEGRGRAVCAEACFEVRIMHLLGGMFSLAIRRK